MTMDVVIMSEASITESEWRVMEVLWDASPRTAGEVIDALSHTEWNHRTIRTLLSRLVKKGYVAAAEQGRSYLYSPKVARSACTSDASNEFLQRFFKGKSSDLILHFIEESELTSKDIDELERLLHQKKGKRRG